MKYAARYRRLTRILHRFTGSSVKDIKRISVLAIIILVALRISIGWQFLYEGLWKHSTLNGPNPWSAEGYLKQSQGPFRDMYVEMAGGDPYDLRWFDFEHVSQEWTDYLDRFKSHYDLTEDQLKALEELENGPETYTAPLTRLPAVLETDAAAKRKWESLRDTIWFDNDQLVVSGIEPITPREISDLQNLVDVVKTPDGQYVMKAEDGSPIYIDPDGEVLLMGPNGIPAHLDENGLPDPEQEVEDWSYQPADGDERLYFIRLEQLLTKCSRGLGYRQRLAAVLLGDPELVGVSWKYDDEDNRWETTMAGGEWNPETDGPLLTFGKIQEYKDTVAQYLEATERAETTGLAFHYEHADRLETKFRSLRSEVVGPVMALDAEFREKVFDLLEVEQLERRPLPPEDTAGHRASMQAMWGLLILGPLLILGLCSRLAAFAGAVMVLSFYLVIPPWPGVPPELALPEHALFVNKNLIEALALLGLAAVPSGTWFGLDGLIARCWSSFRNRGSKQPEPAAPPKPAAPKAGSPPATKK